LPLGAFVGRPEVMSTLAHDPPLAHVTTFGGHPVSCAAGLAALEVLGSATTWPAARADSARRSWAGSAISWGRGGVRAVRGLGLLIGIEFDEPARLRRVRAARVGRAAHPQTGRSTATPSSAWHHRSC